MKLLCFDLLIEHISCDVIKRTPLKSSPHPHPHPPIHHGSEFEASKLLPTFCLLQPGNRRGQLSKQDNNMASVTANSPAIGYLTDAAHLLRHAAPETSAHLLSQRAGLLYSHDLAPSDLQRQHVCAACGHIMMPGHNTELRLSTLRASRRKTRPLDKRAKPGSARERFKEFSCGFCARVTRIPLPAPEPVTRRKAAKYKTQKPASNAEMQKPATANASSKKRAKNRKAGLQALLSGQQRQANPLSLADFMMK